MHDAATNWSGNVRYAGRLHRPASVDALRRLVAGSERIRALGSRHSFNRIADGPGALVLLDGLPADIDLDTDRSTVTVAAGVRYAELAARLQAAGRALPNLGSLPHISVAGSCATATHGSGDRNGCLATAVRALELMTAGGDLVVVTGADPDFAGMVVALGALGVVTRLTLATEPAFDVRQYVYPDLPHERFAERHEQILGAAYSVSLFTTWTAPRFDQVWVKHRLDRPSPGTAAGAEPAPPWPGAVPAGAQRHPIPGLPPRRCTVQLGVLGPWHERLPHFRAEFTPSSGDELQSEYFVPRARLPQAVAALDGMRDRIAPALHIGEIRTVAADELWLSPAYRRDSATIHFTWRSDPDAVPPVIDAVEERLAPLDARPHWGKLFGSRGADAIGRYERLDDFRRLLATHDPAGKFTNAFLDRLVRQI